MCSLDREDTLYFSDIVVLTREIHLKDILHYSEPDEVSYKVTSTDFQTKR